MKKIYPLLFFLMCFRISISQSKTYSVSGTAFIVREYCGGARPTDMVLEQLRTPNPIPSLNLYLKKGESNSQKKKFIKTIITDSLGRFSLQLKCGKYCIVSQNKSKAFEYPEMNQYQKLDSLCYQKEYCTCDLVFNVSKANLKDLKIVFNKYCNWRQPCIEYSGPLPP